MKLLAYLLIAAGLVSGWVLFQQSRRDHEERFWMEEYKAHLKKFTGSAEAGSTQPDEASFYRMLVFLHKAKAANVDFDTMNASAGTDLGLRDDITQMVRDSLLETMQTVERLRLFDDPVNLIRMDHGDPAIIQTPGWKDEKTALVQIVSPVVAPEAAQHILNLLLVPAPVRDAWGDKIGDYVLSRARVLQNLEIIKSISWEHLIAQQKRDFRLK